MFEHFHFIDPLRLLGLAPLALLFGLLIRQSAQGGDSPWRRLVEARLLPHLTEQSDTGIRSKLPLGLLALGWLLAVLALAGPTWERLPQPVYQPPEARIIVLSLNQSMLAPDIKPNRLEQARLKITDMLRRTRGGQTGLVVYADDAFTVTPLTDDINTLQSQLRVLEPDLMPALGDRPERGLALAGELLSQAGRSEGDVILLTDSHGSVATRNEAKRLRQSGYRVSVLGLGTTTGAPVPGLRDQAGKPRLFKLDVAALRDIADAGGGEYVIWQAGGSDLNRLLENSDRQQASELAVAEDRQAERWLNRGPWLVVMLLPLAALAFRRGWLLMTVLVAAPLMQPQALYAAGWSELWQRSDQQAHTALQTGDYDRAIELSDTPERQAEAHYRQGDFQAAAEHFARGEGVDATYNQGNALAKAGKLEEAIKAYDEALAVNPDMEDASFNRKLVEELLQQQQQKQDQQQEQQQEQQESSDSKQDETSSSSESSEQKEEQEQQESSDSKQDETSSSSESSESSEQQESQNQESSQQDAASSYAQEQSDSQQQDQQNNADSSASEQENEEESSTEELANQSEQEQSSAEQHNDAEPQADEFSQAGDEQQQQQANQAVNEARQSAENTEPSQRENASVSEDHLSPEERQQVENYLRRVPDDPGALLRRKFLYQYRQRAQQEGVPSNQ